MTAGTNCRWSGVWPSLWELGVHRAMRHRGWKPLPPPETVLPPNGGLWSILGIGCSWGAGRSRLRRPVRFEGIQHDNVVHDLAVLEILREEVMAFRDACRADDQRIPPGETESLLN